MRYISFDKERGRSFYLIICPKRTFPENFADILFDADQQFIGGYRPLQLRIRSLGSFAYQGKRLRSSLLDKHFIEFR